MLGERATPEKVAALRQQLGLDRPLWVQYLDFVGRLAHGDLGRSIISNDPVSDELGNRFPATAELVVFAMGWGLLLGLPTGVIAALKRNTFVDVASMVIALLGVSMPIFWLGLMMIYLFAVWLKVLPPSGQIDLTIPFQRTTNFYLIDAAIHGNWPAFWSVIRHLILPSLVLSTVTVPILARLTRSAMLEVLNQDYVRTARAKGLRERVVIVRHALRNALLPVVTVVGIQIGGLLGGAILTETIFSWPGMGLWMYQAILNRDYPIVQAGVLVAAVIFVIMNLLVDVSYGILDPRIQLR
jgi:peptide/nickel transport system permease protein